MKEEYISVDISITKTMMYPLKKDEYEEFISVTGHIILDGPTKSKRIGSFIGYIYPKYYKTPFLELADEQSGDMYEIAEAAENIKKLKNKNLLIIDSISIDPEYRNRGIGKEVISNMHVLAKNCFNNTLYLPQYILLFAGAFEERDSNLRAEKDARLEDFYLRCGYSKENGIMIKKV